MVKRAVIIYLIGVFIGWLMTFNYWNDFISEYSNRKLTYGDIAFVSSLSLLSWCDVAAVTILEISELKIWKKPINQ